MTERSLSSTRARAQRRAAMSGAVKVYGYARVSTAQQAEEGASLAEQERQIRARCLAGDNRGPWALAELFVEQISGSIPLAERPAGARLLAALRSGDHIICAKLDRAFRDTVDALTTIRTFRERGIHLWLLDFPGDCSANGVAQLLLGVLASVAEFERQRIAERISEGKAQQRREGKHQGGARPFGYAIAPRQPGDRGAPGLVPLPEEQAAITLMKAMRADHTLREIAETLRARGHEISYEGIRRVLAREAETTLPPSQGPA